MVTPKQIKIVITEDINTNKLYSGQPNTKEVDEASTNSRQGAGNVPTAVANGKANLDRVRKFNQSAADLEKQKANTQQTPQTAQDNQTTAANTSQPVANQKQSSNLAANFNAGMGLNKTAQSIVNNQNANNQSAEIAANTQQSSAEVDTEQQSKTNTHPSSVPVEKTNTVEPKVNVFSDPKEADKEWNDFINTPPTAPQVQAIKPIINKIEKKIQAVVPDNTSSTAATITPQVKYDGINYTKNNTGWVDKKGQPAKEGYPKLLDQIYAKSIQPNPAATPTSSIPEPTAPPTPKPTMRDKLKQTAKQYGRKASVAEAFEDILFSETKLTEDQAYKTVKLYNSITKLESITETKKMALNRIKRTK
jgi:hypothetical protein